MPDLKYCLDVAVNDEQISPADRDILYREYQRMRADASQAMGAAAASAEAKRQLLEWMAAETAHQKRKAKLGIVTIRNLAENLHNFRNARGHKDVGAAALFTLEHNGEAKFTSVAGRTQEIISMEMARIDHAMIHFQRDWLQGDRKVNNQADLNDLRRELFGEDSGNETVKAMAAPIKDMFESLRQQFNAAGGAIGKLENWGLPQRHDAAALINRGLDEWRNYIRPMLDMSKMRHPLTGQPIRVDELDQVLEDIWTSITTDGWATREPTRQRMGASLANQRAEHRFLVFKNSDAWSQYQRDFGGGANEWAAVMMHLRGMASDIAAMQILGPNPSGTIEWMKQFVQKEAALHSIGKPSRFSGNPKTARRRAAYTEWRIQSVWDDIRGAQNQPAMQALSRGAGAIRNIVTAAKLPAAALSAIGDFGTQTMARSFAMGGASTSPVNVMKDVIKYATPEGRADAVAAGLILDASLEMMNREARFAGTQLGKGWTAYVADRTLALTGLTAITQAQKFAFGMAFQREVAAALGKAWDDIPAPLLQSFRRYGIRDSDWERMQRAALHDLGSGVMVLRPRELAARDKKLAMRYVGMIMGETEYAVPSGNHRSRSLTLGGTRPGTVPGELMRTFAQFKSFGVVFAMLHGSRIMEQVWRRDMKTLAGYAGGMAISMAFFGALSLQLKEMKEGRDPRPMNTPEFWTAAMMQGGGIGIYGDFLFADFNRFGNDLATTAAGPAWGPIADFGKLTLGNLAQLASGDDPKFGRELVTFAKKNLPGQNYWYWKLAWERMVWDQVQYMVDPEANAAFKRSQQSYMRDFGQGFWWEKGKALPSRAPDFGGAIAAGF
jgi:hypothetical protein